MSSLRQFFGILSVNLAAVTQRGGSALTIVIGVACAVGALVSMLAMGTGARDQEQGGVRPEHVILTSTGASMFQGSIPRDEATTVRDLPGIARDRDNHPIVVFQTFVPSEARRRIAGNRIFLPIIGTTPNITAYMPDLRFTAGRMFRPGLHELIASTPCARQFTGFDVGDRRDLRGTAWPIVGHVDVGNFQQCFVLADVDTIMSAFSRTTYTAVRVALQSPSDYDRFTAALASNPSLHLEAQHERDAVDEQFKGLNALLNFVSLFIGAIMAIGATLGAMNSLYSIVDSRRRELATLRAIGFGSGAIVASMLCESMLLAVPGAVLGAVLAWLFFNRMSVSPFGFSFHLVVTPSLALIGIEWALAMGLIGGFLPSLRAARVPVTTALRAL